MNLQIVSTRTGEPFQKVHHEGTDWVVAEDGEEYVIEVYNHKGGRVEAVVSVDGLSVMTGQPASMRDRGYIVPGWGMMKISGWRRDRGEVAAFRFGSKPGSYGAQTGRGEVNCGVIGLALFEEQAVTVNYPVFRRVDVPVIREVPIHPYARWPWIVPNSADPGWAPLAHIWCSAGSEGHSDAYFRDLSFTASTPTTASASRRSTCAKSISPSGSAMNSSAPLSAQDFDLGTAYGRALESKIESTAFGRLSSLPMECATLHYASRGALEKMGVPLQMQRPQAMPTAWPGCPAPAGWVR